ncbi:hypothetical protein BGZ59_009601, partial [Podila verticillata]
TTPNILDRHTSDPISRLLTHKHLRKSRHTNSHNLHTITSLLYIMQIKSVVILAVLASVVYAKGNFVCRGFNIEDGCDGKYVCVNAYANCKVNSDNDVDCDCYIKVHKGPF